MTKLVTKIQAAMATRQQEEEGAAMVEYGLLVALIAVVVAVGAATLGGNINDLFENINF